MKDVMKLSDMPTITYLLAQTPNVLIWSRSQLKIRKKKIKKKN
jgi:hypothetical protein